MIALPDRAAMSSAVPEKKASSQRTSTESRGTLLLKINAANVSNRSSEKEKERKKVIARGKMDKYYRDV